MKLPDSELIVKRYDFDLDEEKRSSIYLDNKYPDNTPIVDCKDAWELINTTSNGDVIFRPRSMDSFMTGMMFLKSLKMRKGDFFYLFLPFVPGSRQDRLNDRGDTLFTLKFVADIINYVGFKEVRILDPHSDVTPALIDNVTVLKADSIVPKLEGYNAVIAPDAGAEKRASLVAKKLDVPLIVASKVRDITTGKIDGYNISSKELYDAYNPNAPKVLVVDDICDGGATFLTLGRILKSTCSTADLYVTHGLFSKGTGEILNMYERIYTTDSIITNSVYPTIDEASKDYRGVVLIPACYNEFKEM